ncbi:MAG TPA: TraB/GumN family protein [Rhodanobacteraceae bacterium]|nr:TraB/GumN family protein [Rhodanobacteraceae bacterium]
MKVLRQLCLTAILLFLAAPALADPALWVAKSPTATVYLFGTVHVLPKQATWHYPALDEALAASGTLYVEEDDDNPLTMQMLVLKYGMDLQHPLSSKLNAADRARLDKAATDAGVPGGAKTLDAMQPWLAALTISVAPLLKAGYDPKSGADKQLEREFKAAGKPVAAFEAAEQQIKFFAGLSPALQLDLLHNALDDYAKGPQQIAKIIKAWRAGDVKAIAANVTGGMRKHYHELYAVLLVDRNRNWARQIDVLLKQHGTFFVAVGTGHLAGPDRLQVQLGKLGIHSERVH